MWKWIKTKLKWFFIGSVAFAAGVGVVPDAITAIKLSQEESIYAELDANDVVVRVLVISEENLKTGKWGDPKSFVRTSNKNSIRGVYAGIGYTYNRTKDEFISPRPSDAISYDDAKKEWKRPAPLPEKMIRP